MLKNKIFICFLLLGFLLTGCAKRGSISGGSIDTIPPVIVNSFPKNYSTGFKGNNIRIDFDEYIKVKDVNKQLIISPPMNTQPDIVPMGNASKYINIKIKDTLKENTTYSFNFGQSITDNNEGNPYSQFKFVFSTGSYIDSLTLNGKIKDAYSKQPDNFVTVMLYEMNEKFSDSTIYKEKPTYVTNTLDSMVHYSLQNLKEGKYHLIALKDKNNNYKFDPKADKIAFIKEPVTIPTDTLYLLELFEEVKPFTAIRPAQATNNKLLMGYEGNTNQLNVTVKNGDQIIPSVITKFPDKDSVNVWYPRDIKADSLNISVTKEDYIKDFSVKLRDTKLSDSLSVAAEPRGVINFRDMFIIKPVTPLVKIDDSKISIIDKDSAAVAFKTTYKEFEQLLEIDFEKQEEQKYTVNLMPGAMTDFYGTDNDTLSYNLTTKSFNDYGNLRITLENVNRFPLILEIMDSKGTIKASHYSENETVINFDAILPDKYTLRVIYDDNKNRKWDTGNYLEKRQPEEIIYFPTEVDVRANWDVDQTFNLSR